LATAGLETMGPPVGGERHYEAEPAAAGQVQLDVPDHEYA